VDLSCYMSHGAHGEKHKDCAVTCIKGGAPMGLLASGGRVYLLMSAMGHKSPQDLLLDKVADTVEVTGTENVQGGIRSLTIETVK